jgi:DNA mismatch repair protein MSH5
LQIAFLVAIEKRRVFHHVTGEVRLQLSPDFEHVCDSDDGYSYFKNEDMVYLDNTIGDLDGLIKDEEALIVKALEDDILDQESELRDTFLALSELDCILSFAIIAKDRAYVRPTILPQQQDSNTIVRVKNGRHPLQEILVEGKFIPNRIDIDGEKRVNVVTGPNFSGKSCYARQVGVLVYMAQIGSFLPCETAQLSVVDNIFAQFSSVETCTVPQSSFQLDLTQMGSILRRATPKSLVLIDEFGKGELQKGPAYSISRAGRSYRTPMDEHAN